MMEKEWSKAARYFVLTMACVSLAWLLISARSLVGPLIIAALLAYALYPAVTFITARTNLRRVVVVNLVYVLFLIVLITVLVVFVPVAVSQVTRLSIELQSIRIRLENLSATPATFLGLDVPFDEFLAEFDAISSAFLTPKRIFRVISAATSNLGWVLVILVAAYYLLRDWGRVREWFISLAPAAYQPDVRRLHQEVKVVWHAYLRGQLLLMFVVGVLSGLISAAVGLPGAVAFGVLAGILELIPSLGPTATAVVAAMVAWFEGSTHLPLPNVWFSVVVVALFSLVQLVENVWLLPRIMGRRMRLNPGLVFVAIVGALALSGVLVALISVPLLGTVIVVGRYVHRRLLGLRPWPEAQELVSEVGDLRGRAG